MTHPPSGSGCASPCHKPHGDRQRGSPLPSYRCSAQTPDHMPDTEFYALFTTTRTTSPNHRTDSEPLLQDNRYPEGSARRRSTRECPSRQTCRHLQSERPDPHAHARLRPNSHPLLNPHSINTAGTDGRITQNIQIYIRIDPFLFHHQRKTRRT